MLARNRARARFALAWRPKFLAILALTKAPMIAARAAKVAYQTCVKHRKADPDFDVQWMAAEEHALQLLHDVTMKSAIEGECEPVFWQGIQVGHVRKVDNRLRIEMLRAHLPSKFKTPGSGQPLVSGNNNQVLVITPEQRDELVRLRQEALEAMNPPKALTDTASNEAVCDSGNSSGGVQ